MPEFILTIYIGKITHKVSFGRGDGSMVHMAKTFRSCLMAMSRRRRTVQERGLELSRLGALASWRSHGKPLVHVPSIFCLLITSIFYFTAAINTATAATYYIDAVDGNDSNPGTSEGEAWKTLPYAAENVSGGDTIYIRGGTYDYWQMYPAPSYSSTVTWQAYQDEIPDINGLRWQQNTGVKAGNLKFAGIKFTGEVTIRGFSLIEVNDCNFSGDGYKFGYIHQEPNEYEDTTALSIENCNCVYIYKCNISGTGSSLKDIWGADINSGVGSFNPNNFGKGWGEGISMINSPNSIISGCTISQVDTGIRFRDGTMKGSKISNNTIRNVTNDGITIAGCDNVDGVYSYIEYNHIYNLAHFSIYYEGVWQDHSAHNDCIQFFTNSGAYKRPYKNIIIQRNIAHDSDQQGFFTQCEEEDVNIIWQNNLLYNIPHPNSSSSAHTVYLQMEDNSTFRNNTVIGDLLTRYGDYDSIYGNIIYRMALYTEDDETTVDYENYNIIQATGYHMDNHVLGSNTIDVNDAEFRALFVDYDNHNYQLTTGSTAINHGLQNKAPSVDLLQNLRGSNPDAGCYEYVPSDSNGQYNLTISSTSGGSVTTPGEAGPYSYDHGTVVSILATAASNYHFVNWTGTAVDADKVANSNVASTTVTMDADYSVQANFAIDQHNLITSSTSGGSVTTPGEAGPYSYEHGTVVSIEATADANYYFVNWTGTAVNAGKVANSNAASTTVTMDADYGVQANFAEQDKTAPSVTNRSPDANSIQVPLNNLVTFHIVDTDKGVDANSVTIRVNNNIVYTGNTADYSSVYGHCRRTGTKTDYTFIYQSNELFDFDQTVSITVNATDLAGNTMSEYSYSFKTKMRSFGKNKKVNSGSDNLSKGGPATVRDSSGNIWVVWHTGPTDSREIYVGRLTAGADNFGSSVQLTDDATDQCNATIAVDADDKLYVVWQDNRRGNWDIYVSTSVDGVNWSAERRVTDSNDNEINPAIVVDGFLSNKAYIVWQDDRWGNQDIYVASSINDFATKTISQVTSDSSDQTEPAIAADYDDTIYIVWTDKRNGGKNDIYGAASNDGPWTNVPIVSKEDSQSSPAIATEATGSILHLLWIDDTPGDDDIFYAKTTGGLPESPLSGSSIIDDDSSADQLEPVIAVTGSTDNNLVVFACWQDERNVSGSNADTDLYFVEISSGSRTNVLVGDDSMNTDQSEPAMGMDGDGYPYLVWADSRNANTDIYYAGSTFVENNALASEDISASSTETTIVGTNPKLISGVDDVSIEVPAGAYLCDITITISRVKNPPEITLERFSLPYDFGPSGIEFSEPVTITIPYEVPAAGKSTSAYWYNPLTATLSQEGITNIENIVISPTLHALRFKTTHFTQFFVGGSSGSGSSGGGGGGGGGCSISRSSQANLTEFLLPYIGLAVVVIILKQQDARNRKARSTT